MIIVIGSINMDMVATLGHHPAPGETVLANEYAQYHGGKGANQAVAAARVGAEVRMIGAVGNDAFADQLVNELYREHIDIDSLQYADCNSGLAMISVDKEGENRIVVVSGANATLLPQSICAANFSDASIVLLQLEIPFQTVRRAATIAHDAGATVVLNAAPASRLQAQDLALIDWLLVNAGEAAHLLGEEPAESLAGAQLQADALGNAGPSVLITLGGEGVVWRHGSESGHIAALTAEIVDSTGAGDAFAGVFVQSLDAGWPIRDCLQRANAAGALAVERIGARDSLPTGDQLQARLSVTNCAET